MDTPIPEFLAEAANKRVSDIFIIAGRPLAEKIDGHLFSSGDRLMPEPKRKHFCAPFIHLRKTVDISGFWKPVTMTFLFPFPAFPFPCQRL